MVGWIVLFVIIVSIAFTIMVIKSEQDYQSYLKAKKIADEAKALGERAEQVANKILLDSRTGCRFSGSCRFDCDNSQDKSCYCNYYKQRVQRKSPCDHFQPRK